jgi:hypothetical protein
MEKIELYDYQKNLLKVFNEEQFVLVKQSRQMGISTLLCEYILEEITYNEDRHIVILSSNQTNGIFLLDNIKLSLKNTAMITNTRKRLKLINGNRIDVITTHNDLRGTTPNIVIIDNAGFIDNFEKIINYFIKHLLPETKIIINSNNNTNSYFNKLYNDKNKFYKVLIPWVLHPNRDNIWYEKIKENYGGSIDMFNSEINLIDIPNKTNKNRVVTIRVNDDILNKITDKLLERDLSISEYIRQLIESDN